MFSENILVLTTWSFPDALIQTYTLPYVKIMKNRLSQEKKIWLLTQEKKPISSHCKEQMEMLNKNENIKCVPIHYLPFGFKAIIASIVDTFRLLFLCYRNKIKVIHVFCTTAGVMGHLLSILTGAVLIIDSYEPHAEAMVENGSWSKKSVRFNLLFTFEKWMSKKAKIVIAATEGMRDYALVKYNSKFDTYFVKPACVDFSLFGEEKIKNKTLAESLGLQGKTVMVYAGKLGGIYLETEVFDFVKVANEYFGDNFRFLLLTTHKQEEVKSYCEKANLPLNIVVSLFVKHAEIANYIGLADFGLTPVRPVPSKRYCTPIKNGEYWALGLPIVITKDISDDSDIIENENIGAVIQSLNKESYLEAVKKIDSLLNASNKDELRTKIRGIAKKYRSFEIAERIYSKIYC